jgi:tetratricopeptide (TPR) repeat protein
MNKQTILFTIIGLLAGFIFGFFLANNINRNAVMQPAIAQTGTNSPFLNSQNPQTQSVSIKEQNGTMMPEIAQTLERAKNAPNDFVAQIRAGEVYLKIQNLEKANEFFTKAAEVHQDNFQDLATLGNAFFDIKKYEEAEKWYSKALEKNPDDIDVRTDLGSTFMERQPPDFDRAIKEYRTSLEKNPKHESTIFNLSVALFRKGDLQGARDMLAQLKQINPQSDLIARLEQKISGKSSPN